MKRPWGVIIFAILLMVAPAWLTIKAFGHLNFNYVLRAHFFNIVLVVLFIILGAGLLQLRNWARCIVIGLSVVNALYGVQIYLAGRGYWPALIYSLLWALVIWYFLKPSIRMLFTRSPTSIAPKVVLIAFIMSSLIPLHVSYDSSFPMYEFVPKKVELIGGEKGEYSGIKLGGDKGFGFPFPYLIQQYDAFAYMNHFGALYDMGFWLALYFLVPFFLRKKGPSPVRIV